MLNSRASPGAQTAAQTDLDALAVTVGLKANQSDVASLSTALGTKASQTDHDLLDTAFATQSSLLSLTTLLLGAKASQTDLTNLTTSVANHVSLIANPFSSSPPPCFYRVWYKRFASAMPPNNHAESELASAERTGSISGTASTVAVHDASFTDYRAEAKPPRREWNQGAVASAGARGSGAGGARGAASDSGTAATR